jgi:hypothetical protein
MRRLVSEKPSNWFLGDLPPEAQDIIDAGWRHGPNGELVLAALWGTGWERRVGTNDLANREYEINDVYIDCTDLVDNLGTYLNRAANRGLLFGRLALEKAQLLDEYASLVAVVSVGIEDDFLTHGTTVKLFTRRGNYPNWFQDLERFTTEAMAIIYPSDVAEINGRH